MRQLRCAPGAVGITEFNGQEFEVFGPSLSRDIAVSKETPRPTEAGHTGILYGDKFIRLGRWQFSPHR
jgi:hypothetical protein